jgi:hypothetical protein
MLYSVALPLPGPSWHLLGRTSTRHASGRLALQLQKSKNVPQIPCFILHTPCMFETQAQRRAAGLRTGLSCVTFGRPYPGPNGCQPRPTPQLIAARSLPQGRIGHLGRQRGRGQLNAWSSSRYPDAGHGPKPPRFSQTGSLGPSVSLLAHAFLVPSSLRVTKYRDPKWVKHQ